MNISFTPQSWEDYRHWLQTDKKILKRINDQIKDTMRSPLDGIGKPEPLGQGLSLWAPTHLS
ncbi:MAG: type II toxin-antitoxin system YoeB family toxin [Verrucomicrobia bacterium]|nr:type II toxin-antitoxin system YoeB family toxin [Verrucomicrobiota bacterium]